MLLGRGSRGSNDSGDELHLRGSTVVTPPPRTAFVRACACPTMGDTTGEDDGEVAATVELFVLHREALHTTLGQFPALHEVMFQVCPAGLDLALVVYTSGILGTITLRHCNNNTGRGGTDL